MKNKLLNWLSEKKIVDISRVSHNKSIEDVYRSCEPVKIEFADGKAIFVTVDEGKGNLLLFDYESVLHNQDLFGPFQHWSLISDKYCLPCNASRIQGIANPSHAEYDGWYEFCGVCIHGISDEPVCIGTHLTCERLMGLRVLPLPQTTNDLVFYDFNVTEV